MPTNLSTTPSPAMNAAKVADTRKRAPSVEIDRARSANPGRTFKAELQRARSNDPTRTPSVLASKKQEIQKRNEIEKQRETEKQRKVEQQRDAEQQQMSGTQSESAKSERTGKSTDAKTAGLTEAELQEAALAQDRAANASELSGQAPDTVPVVEEQTDPTGATVDDTDQATDEGLTVDLAYPDAAAVALLGATATGAARVDATSSDPAPHSAERQTGVTALGAKAVQDSTDQSPANSGEHEEGEASQAQTPAPPDTEEVATGETDPTQEPVARGEALVKPAPAHASSSTTPEPVNGTTVSQPTTDRAGVTPNPPAAAPEARFAQDNHPTIITGVTGKLMPNGGTMHIRLDPPEMGALSVTIRIDRGVVEASFQTSNDQATQLLGHSLNQLKSALESAGVSVDKLNVSQVNDPKQPGSNTPQDPQDSQQSQEQARQFQQEQQRREMLKRMWQKLSGADDLNMVA